MPGRVEQITTSPRPHELPSPVDEVVVVAGQGPRGARELAPKPMRRRGKDLTLIGANVLSGVTIRVGDEVAELTA